MRRCALNWHSPPVLNGALFVNRPSYFIPMPRNILQDTLHCIEFIPLLRAASHARTMEERKLNFRGAECYRKEDS